MPNTFGFILSHPLTKRQPGRALARYVGWQVGSRLRGEHRHRWIEGATLVVRNGMTGATGNIYCGLHEFADMGFLLHFLRPDDVFLDIGANVGTYTVLSSKVCGARTHAFEPDPGTIGHLRRNVAANGIEDRVVLHETALGAADGKAHFTVGHDTTNRIAAEGDTQVRTVRLAKLDTIPEARRACFIKLDVEGHEADVLAGARTVLNASSLCAIETEGSEPAVVNCLLGAGFVRRWYDPRSRSLSPAPVADLSASNALFVRDEPGVALRLRSAPVRQILGVNL